MNDEFCKVKLLNSEINDSNLHLQTSQSLSCENYTKALKASKQNVYARSCGKPDESYDDVIFDTTIREDSVVTDFGFTCDSHSTTDVGTFWMIYLDIIST